MKHKINNSIAELLQRERRKKKTLCVTPQNKNKQQCWPYSKEIPVYSNFSKYNITVY